MFTIHTEICIGKRDLSLIESLHKIKHRPLTCNFQSASFRYCALFLSMEFSPGQVKRITLNLSKTAGKCLKHPIYFTGTLIRSASLYRYLGFTISSSGKFNQCKLDLYKKSMKAYFKLQNCLLSTNPSIDTFLHLYDHTIKPILTYGSELWGMFSVDSSSCRKKSDYCFEFFFSTSHTEQSHLKMLKYILGVNRKTTNIAVMSEPGRYPIFFF